MRKRFGSCLTVFLMVCLLFTGAQAEKTTTYHAMFEVIYHPPDFAYQVTSLSAISGQAVQAQVMIYALEREVLVTNYTFALYDPQSRFHFYADTVSMANAGPLLGNLITLPAGMNCELTYHVPYQGSELSTLYWVYMIADSYSCTQFNYMPPQANAHGYSTADEFFNPSGYTGKTDPNTSGYPSSVDRFFNAPYDAGTTYVTGSDWDYSYAPVDDFFSADSIDFGSLGGSYTATSAGSFVTCFPCRGTGVCGLCDGKGKLHIGTVAECTCPSCYGTGDCVYCHGSGMLESTLP